MGKFKVTGKKFATTDFFSVVFQPIQYNVDGTDSWFTDGGTLDNYPVHIFDGNHDRHNSFFFFLAAITLFFSVHGETNGEAKILRLRNLQELCWT